MPTELTEEEMRRALFGGAQASAPVEVHVHPSHVRKAFHLTEKERPRTPVIQRIY